MFLYKNLFFSISSVISIPIMLIGINGGYFPAICRVCFSFVNIARKPTGVKLDKDSNKEVFSRTETVSGETGKLN